MFSSSLGLFLSTFSFVSSPKLSHSHSHSHSLFVSSLHFVCASIEKEKKRAEKNKRVVGPGDIHFPCKKQSTRIIIIISPAKLSERERERDQPKIERKKEKGPLLADNVRTQPTA